MYTSEICPYVAVGRGQDCPMGDQCFRAHNRVEEFYHPDKYKAPDASKKFNEINKFFTII